MYHLYVIHVETYIYIMYVIIGVHTGEAADFLPLQFVFVF